LGFVAGLLSCRDSPTVETNESLIAGAQAVVDLDDATSVFQHVFSALPLRATVYPSGDNYYFSFLCSRGLVRGNIRLKPELRADRVVGISYSLGVPGRDKTVSVRIGPRQGLYMIGLSRRAWLCYYRWRAIVFLLNPIVVAPPVQAHLLPGEAWSVPAFDESGLQFHLVFQAQPAHLFWILNRDPPITEDFEHPASDIAIGRRTRFAFYVDKPNHRWILIGVDRRNTIENTWYDGPFDQLPNETNLGHTEFRKYLETTYPNTRGQIDDYGRYKLLPQSDVAVTPWTLYDKVDDLAFIKKCKQTLNGPAFYSCITPDPFAGLLGKGE
jgi:hypothetical protein